MAKPSKAKVSAEDKQIRDIVKKFQLTDRAWSVVRKDQVEDVKFYNGEQYDPVQSRAAQVRNGAPLIQVNYLQPMVQQIENQIRMMNPSLVVHATDEKGSEEMADIFGGLIRHIENNSQASTAYQYAAGINGALVPGMGFIKVTSEYVDSTSFDQDLKIVPVKDPFKILPDFSFELPDGSDAEFWFEFDDIDKDVYKETYKDSMFTKNEGLWTSMCPSVGEGEWIKNDTARICKYWYKKKHKKCLAQFEDGTVGFLDDYGLNEDGEQINESPDSVRPLVETSEAEKQAYHQDNMGALAPSHRHADIKEKRYVIVDQVWWLTTNGVEKLEEGEWHTDDFPFVAVVGKDVIVDGKRDMYGVIRHSKDPQKMLNFMTSAFVRRIAASNNAPWIYDLETIPEKLRPMWERSHIDPVGALGYDSKGGTRQAPTRGDAIEPAVQALLEGSMKFANDIKNCIGTFGGGMGDDKQGNLQDQSGAAVLALAQRGDMNNLHFAQNLTCSMNRLGRILIKAIPRVYTGPRTVRIIGTDDQATLIQINQVFNEHGEDKCYDLTDCGSYDCVVDTGPSYATRKAEQGDILMKFGALYPEFVPVIADLIASDLDITSSQAIVDRLKMWQAANVPYLSSVEDLHDLPPAARSIIAKMQAELQQAQQHLQVTAKAYQHEKIKNDTNAVNNASKERIETIKATTAINLKILDLKQQIGAASDQKQLAILKTELHHIQATKKIHLDMLKHIDKVHNTSDESIYSGLEKNPE